MPYITSQEIKSHIEFADNQFTNFIQNPQNEIDSDCTHGQMRAYYHDVFFNNPKLSTEKKNLIYAQWNFIRYEQTLDQTYFKEARKYFEKVATPFSDPHSYQDYRAQAHFFLGALWEKAYELGHTHLSRDFERDPRQLAVKHFQQVQLPTNGPDRDSNDLIRMFLQSRKKIAVLFLGFNASFPQNEREIKSLGIFKPDHLRSIVAIIEMYQTQKKFADRLNDDANDFGDLPTQDVLRNILSRYCNTYALDVDHLVFLEEGNDILTPAQQYKIARACYDRKMIDDLNFQVILRRIHHNIKDSQTPGDEQLRRNVKFYLAKLSLQLNYAPDQDYVRRIGYRKDLAAIYNDLIGSKKHLYRKALAKRKPKALAAQSLISDLMIDGDQKIPYSDPLTHGYEVTTPFMGFFSTVLAFILGVFGFVVDIIPRIFMSGGVLALQIIAIPFALAIGLCCCAFAPRSRGDDYGWLYLLFPLLLLGLVFKPFHYNRSSEGSGIWGQRIENTWLDTGFTFIFRKIGAFIGNVIGFCLGLSLSIITYIPRLFCQVFINLISRSSSDKLQASDIPTILNGNRISLEIEKAPLDYLREEKRYSNYQQSDKKTVEKQYKEKFLLYQVGDIKRDDNDKFRFFTDKDPRNQGYFNAPPVARSSNANPTAPARDLLNIDPYDNYVATAPAFEPQYVI